VDEADLVLIAAAASGADPGLVLDGTDVAALARIASCAQAAPTPEAAAAAVLVGVARGRPFPHGNRAAAWLAAAHVLARNGRHVRIRDEDALALVSGAERGDDGEGAVAWALAGHSVERRRGLRRALGWMVSPLRGSVVETRPCPLCSRPVRVHARDMASMPPGASARLVVSARCWRQNRAHGRDGRPHPALPPVEDDDGRWCPVVTGPSYGGRRAFAGMVGAGGVVFLPAPAGPEPESYEAVLVPGLCVSDLVGDWRRLSVRGVALGRAQAAWVRFDAAGVLLDWQRLAGFSGGPLARLAPGTSHARLVPAGR
jgi:prophage maintenance system killer protein